jgi:hypothetical protein
VHINTFELLIMPSKYLCPSALNIKKVAEDKVEGFGNRNQIPTPRGCKDKGQ